MGNTCYVNAVVQALMGVPCFAYMLKTLPISVDDDDDDEEDEENHTSRDATLRAGDDRQPVVT